MEKRIFYKLDQERMLKAPDFNRAFEVLYDTDLGEAASSKKEIEEILEQDIMQLKKLFSSILENKNIILFLFLSSDASNLKLSLKKTSEGRPRSKRPRSDLGHLAMKLLKGLDSRDSRDSRDPKDIEIAVDKAYFKLKLKLAQKLRPFLKELTKLEIDLLNLKLILSRRYSFNVKSRISFLQGGNFNKRELLRISKHKEAKLLETLEEFLEEYKFSAVLKNFQKTKCLIKLEKDFQNLLSEEIFQRARQTSSGIEKILCFFQKKLNAQHNIRLILFAKSNKIPITEIQDKLLII